MIINNCKFFSILIYLLAQKEIGLFLFIVRGIIAAVELFCLNSCFSLIYKVFIAAFNLYNPAYLSLFYNIYFAFLSRVDAK